MGKQSTLANYFNMPASTLASSSNKRAAPVTMTPLASAKKVKVVGKGKEKEDDDGDVPEKQEKTPFAKLYTAMTEAGRVKALAMDPEGVVVYWMR